MLVIDTSAVIGMTERRDQKPGLTDLIRSAESDTEIVTTEITLGELRHGVAVAKKTSVAASRRRTLNAISELITLSISNNHDVLDQYASLRTRTQRCSQNDTWIIAICAAAGATLVTEDRDMSKLAKAGKVDVLFLENR